MKNKTLFIILTILSLVTSTCCYFYFNKKENEITVSSNQQTKDKIAYLTFDDGPSANTEKILETLDKYNIKATFFVTGPSYKFKNDLLIKIRKIKLFFSLFFII